MDSEYQLSSTHYSPDGRIPQIDYAARAVSNSYTVIGIRGKNAVVLAADKIIKSSLYEPDADERILTIEKNIGMAIAGFTPDGQRVAEVARHEAVTHRVTLSAAIPLRLLCERAAGYIHSSTLHGIKRPLGVSAILSSWDAEYGPQLYKVEPCGRFLSYYACANGRSKPQAMQEFDKLENIPEMETEELVKKAGEIIYKGHYDKRKRPFRFEMGIVGEATGGLHLVNPPELTEMARNAGEEAILLDSSSSDEVFF